TPSPTPTTPLTSSPASTSSALLANATGLAGFSEGAVYLGIDYKTVNPAGGRASVRLESKKNWTQGLFIADIKHMPGSACGVWPAFWTFGEPWPTKGEIDIIEGVSMQSNNSATLHTSKGCKMEATGSTQGATLINGDCMGEANAGCSIHSNTANTFGTGFNSIGGGVYAMEWTSSAISISFFPRPSIPADITAGTPDPSKWPSPQARFSGGGCNIDQYFNSHKMIFNTAFCGDWAGKIWDSDASCKALAPTCDKYVGDNPTAFKEAYWLINSVVVYRDASAKRDVRKAFKA
ncbi:putative endo-1,3(4)-beta-glucanase, partial [Amylocarpus encephaloides]